MISSVVDPLENEYPDLIEHQLKDGIAVSCAFNRRGTLLAAGCMDGSIIIWDFETFSVAARLRNNTMPHPVISLSWSRDGRQLISAQNGNAGGFVSVWEVVSAKVKTIELRNHHVNRLSTHPREYMTVLVSTTSTSLSEPAKVIVDRESGEHATTTVKFDIAANDGDSDDDNGDSDSGGGHSKGRVESNQLAVYDRRATMIVASSTSGTLSSYEPDTLLLKNRVRNTNSKVLDIVFSRDNAYFITNGTDRVLRLYSTKNFLRLREFQDVVNRDPWINGAFSSNADFVIAVPQKERYAQRVFIWDRTAGRLVKILEGPKDDAQQMLYHPQRPIVITLGRSGVMYVWTKSYLENWSAFAPDFEQLNENVEYIEREDEFDLITTANDGDASTLANGVDHDDDGGGGGGDDDDDDEERPLSPLPADVELFNIENADVFSECEDELIHLPVALSVPPSPSPDTTTAAAAGDDDDDAPMHNNTVDDDTTAAGPPPTKRQRVTISIPESDTDSK